MIKLEVQDKNMSFQNHKMSKNNNNNSKVGRVGWDGVVSHPNNFQVSKSYIRGRPPQTPPTPPKIDENGSKR